MLLAFHVRAGPLQNFPRSPEVCGTNRGCGGERQFLTIAKNLPGTPNKERLDQFRSAPTANRFAINGLAVLAPNAFEARGGGHPHSVKNGSTIVRGFIHTALLLCKDAGRSSGCKESSALEGR